MFHAYYATTKDRKGNEHNYKLPAGEGVPNGHEITNLAVASRYKLTDFLSPGDLEVLTLMSSKGKSSRAKA